MKTSLGEGSIALRGDEPRHPALPALGPGVARSAGRVVRRPGPRRAAVWLTAVLLSACNAPTNALAPVSPVSGASPEAAGSALWRIVYTCVNPGVLPRCECPSFARSCCGDSTTPDAAVVWAETPDFVVIRDMKMCACPGSPFVAGLALPRTRCTGIEDPRRPEGIWAFAFDVARERIGAREDIALVVNPPQARTQGQLHVHLLRLQPAVRARLDRGEPLPGAPTTFPLATLDAPFAALRERLGPTALEDHGLLIAADAKGGGFVAIATRRSSPEVYTRARCGE